MNEQEFLQKATSKIYNFRKKQIIAGELHDHILLKKQRFEEAGYTEEQAEEKSVEAMGNAEDIADALGKLYKSYNAAPDIIFLLITCAALAGSYFALERFVFGDPGVLSLLLCGILDGVALFCLYAAYASFKKHPTAALCVLLAGAGTGYYEYLLTNELSRLTDGSFTVLWNYIINGELYFNRNQQSTEMQTAVLSILGVLFLTVFLFVLLYGIKKVTCNNRKIDNGVNKITTILCIALFAVSAIFSAYFGISTINRIQAFQSEYEAAFQFVIDIEKNCSTQEEVSEFLEGAEYSFSTDGEESVGSYGYSHNLVNIYIDCYTEPEPFDPEDYDTGMERLYNEMIQKQDYAERYVYNISLSSEPQRFANDYDSLTLAALKADEETIEVLYSFRPYEHTTQERYEYFIKYTPTLFTVKKCSRELANSEFEFKYIEGSGEAKETEYFSFTTETQELLDFKAREAEIIEILKKTDSRDRLEIAQLTGTTASDPGFTREEYEEFIDYCCIYLGEDSEIYQNRDLALDLYDSFIEYKIYDEWSFTLYRLGEENIVIFDNNIDVFEYLNNPKDLYIDEVDLSGKPLYGAVDYEPFNKLTINGGFFDKKGLYYDSAEKIRYYTPDGEAYRYDSMIDMNEAEDNKKKYLLKNNEGANYSADICFIDPDGWLVIDENAEITQSADGTYRDSGGKIFTPVFETSWDQNGDLLFAEDLE